MAAMKAWLAGSSRGLEQRLGIDREGRTVWVWLLPPAVGVASGVLIAFMPGLPDSLSWAARLPFSVFAFMTMTLIASIYLIQFDNDHNQEAAVDDDPGRGDDGPETAAGALGHTAAELARRAGQGRDAAGAPGPRRRDPATAAGPGRGVQ